MLFMIKLNQSPTNSYLMIARIHIVKQLYMYVSESGISKIAIA